MAGGAGARPDQPVSRRVCYPFCRKHGRYRAVKRREFITLLGGAAAWPLTARAQQQRRRVSIIGVLWHAGSAEEEGSNFKALVKGFRDLGYIEGRNIIIEHRFPNEEPDRFTSMAAELVASGVDVLIGVGANAAPYAKEATTTIPVIFVLVSDPIGSNKPCAA